MEALFGHKFRDVRIHSDKQAASSARAVDALAYTVGSHIAFDTGRFRPDMGEGRELLAHELAHVVQQSPGSGPAALYPDNAPHAVGTTLEREANQAAKQVAAGERATVGQRSGLSLARQPNPRPPTDVDAFHGIEMYVLVEEVPHSDFVLDKYMIRAKPYLLVPQLRGSPDGPFTAVYYIAYNNDPDSLRNEWIIGPDSIDRFIADITQYEKQANMLYMWTPPREQPPDYVVKAWRSQVSMMKGEIGKSFSLLGGSWKAAAKDPGWWVSAVTATAGGLASAPARTAPALTLIEGGGEIAPSIAPSVAGRGASTFTVVRGGAAPALAVAEADPVVAAAARPAPQLVYSNPNPVTPLSPVPAPVAVGVAAVTALAGQSASTGTAAAPAAAPQPATDPQNLQSRAPVYPLLWPSILPPPPQTQFVHTPGADRDDELAETLNAGKWIRARGAGLSGRDLQAHHVIPLFLGGQDVPSNVILWNTTLHRRGHACLRDQPQMMLPPPPLAPLPADILKHPAGTFYRLAGFKICP